MSLNTKKIIVFVLGIGLCIALIMVAEMESRKHLARTEMPLATLLSMTPETSRECVECHEQQTPGLVSHWKGSTHAEKGVACVECHVAEKGDVDGFDHYGQHIATVVTPRDCARCHPKEADEFQHSHHAKGGNILASLDNFLAETVEGHRGFFNPHSPTPGRPEIADVNGFASAFLGCHQCHGSKVGFLTADGGKVTVDDLKPGPDGRPTNLAAMANVVRDQEGKPKYHPGTWPNTGIGRINLDGSLGSCSACHSRHDFSPRRARQPENCGKCHLGPDHPQKEIYEESKHGVAYRDLRDQMNLDAKTWVLGKDYSAAPTCATCHMSAHSKGAPVTHNPGQRISWTNRPPISLAMDTDANNSVVKETDPEKRAALVVDTAMDKRNRMKEVCHHCHTPDYVNGFYKQYDDLVVLFNEKFAKPGTKIIQALRDQGLITKIEFDEEIEWSWYYLWHHEGRRARHGASMMAPDYTHWHGMYEVAERFYMEVIPQAKEIAEHAITEGKEAEGRAVLAVIDEILARPEHQWQASTKNELKK
ncbi:MAG: hydroxylamine oxidoreductase [Phycisphaerae bacterium]|nr:hydroxylamine oxidoreductase [Phycisphaerae bacterium]